MRNIKFGLGQSLNAEIDDQWNTVKISDLDGRIIVMKKREIHELSRKIEE